MPTFPSLSVPLLLCALSVVLLGCDSPGRMSAPGPAAEQGLITPRMEEPSAPTPIPDPMALLPLRPADLPYRILEGERAGSRIVVTIKKVDDPAMPWRRHTAGNRIEHLGVDEEGNIVAGVVEDLTHNATTYYDPPMVVIPAHLEPGEMRTFTSEMRVVNRDNPDQQRGTGTSTKTILHDADQVIVTPAGRFECRRFQTVYTTDLSLADVEVTTTEWYAPGEGLIAEDYHENIRAMLIININTKRKMVRTGE